MRIPILLFLTLSSLFMSCNKSVKETRKFDLDSHSFLFFNEGSYWVYEDAETNIFDTVTLVEVEQGYKDDKDGDDYVEYRIDKYWSSANQHFFTRTSQDTSIYIFNSQFKHFENRDIFKFTNKYHTYYSDVEKEDQYADNYFYIDEVKPNMTVAGVTGFGKAIMTNADVIVVADSVFDLSGNFVELDTIYNELGQYIGIDSVLIDTAFGAKTTYVSGIGMVQHVITADTTEINLRAFYLAPDSE